MHENAHGVRDIEAANNICTHLTLEHQTLCEPAVIPDKWKHTRRQLPLNATLHNLVVCTTFGGTVGCLSVIGLMLVTTLLSVADSVKDTFDKGDAAGNGDGVVVN